MSGGVLVVGAGAAGLLAALTAARGGASVRLLDHNGHAGRKLNITGKGRCNVTNDCDIDSFLRQVPRNPRFLHSALAALTPQDTMALMESLGVPLIVERGQRVFPASGRARDITDALTRALSECGVRTEKRHVTALWRDESGLRGVCCGAERIEGSAVVLATGGLSYPGTGADGSGYALARQAGHTITAAEPSLVALLSPDGFCTELTGLSLKNVSLSLVHQGKTVYAEGPGELLFTHTGLSGPLVLSASAHWQPGWDARIDLKPGLTAEQLDARLLRELDAAPNAMLGNLLHALEPRSLCPVVLTLAELPPDTRAHAVTRPQRLRLGETLKSLSVRISGKADIKEAIITRGGVEVREISPKTMESKLLSSLYIAGELLDVDAYTGGYNLQIAFSTGWAAGRAITEKQRGGAG